MQRINLNTALEEFSLGDHVAGVGLTHGKSFTSASMAFATANRQGFEFATAPQNPRIYAEHEAPGGVDYRTPTVAAAAKPVYPEHKAPGVDYTAQASTATPAPVLRHQPPTKGLN